MEQTPIPKRLYKYRAFNILLLRQITSANLYYSNPRDFNDPLDCDPSIEIDSDVPMLENLCYAMLKQTLSEDEAVDRIHTAQYNSTEYDSELTAAQTEGYHKQLLASEIKRDLDRELGSKGVLSLSATWSSPLMWSHYADHHRGICVEYDTTRLEHPHLNPVNYRVPRSIKTSDMIEWKLNGSELAARKISDTFFLAKSPQWKYEREWRDIRCSSGVSSGDLVISGIYFGMRCEYAVIASLIHLLDRESGIEFYDVFSHDHSFRLHRRVAERGEVLSRPIRIPAALLFKDVFLSDEAGTK